MKCKNTQSSLLPPANLLLKSNKKNYVFSAVNYLLISCNRTVFDEMWGSTEYLVCEDSNVLIENEEMATHAYEGLVE